MTYLSGLLAAVFVLGLLLVLFGIVRWSIVSSIRTRGGAARLRRPDPDGVARLTGIPVERSLCEMYQADDRVSRESLVLVDGAGKEWWVGAFFPLAVPDVSEWRKLTRVTGIPIASDMLKGVYYVTATGAVRLQSPEGDVEVARSIPEFRGFEERESSEDDA